MKKECFFLFAAMWCTYTWLGAETLAPDANAFVMSPSPVVSPLLSQADTQQDIVRERLNSYEKRIDAIKWAIDSVLIYMGFFITVIFAAGGFIAWKNQREYHDSLTEMKEAVKEVKQNAARIEKLFDKVKVWEKEAQKASLEIGQQAKVKLEEFDKSADEKFQELGDVTKQHVQDIFDQAEKQRHLTEKWNMALKFCVDKKYESADDIWKELAEEQPGNQFLYAAWGYTFFNWAKDSGTAAEGRYRQACEKYQRAVEIKPDYHIALYGWGTTLSEWGKISGSKAEERYTLACEKFEESVKFKPDYCEAFNNWGQTLCRLAIRKGSEAERWYRLACEKYDKATRIKPDYHEAFNNWGYTLGEWAKCGGSNAEERFCQACEKYSKAVEIMPDFYQTYINWSATLLVLGAMYEGDEKKRILDQAEEKCLRAEEIKEGAGAYNLACVHALRGDEENCRFWLLLGERKGTLATYDEAVTDEDLRSMRDKAWFREIKWKDDLR